MEVLTNSTTVESSLSASDYILYSNAFSKKPSLLPSIEMNLLLTLLLLWLHGIKTAPRTASVQGWLLVRPHHFVDKFCHTELCANLGSYILTRR